jgi:hydroxyacylglutathione hydrolase
MKIKTFTFNHFFENTYVLSDETGECVIIDPGCSQAAEQNELRQYIEAEGLKPVRLLNTHCHIDHILGNGFVKDSFGLKLEAHENEKPNIAKADAYAMMFGMERLNTPNLDLYIKEGDTISFGHTSLDVLFTPGHLVFNNRDQNVMIGGDVLFRESIGRTDLPGGDYDTLIRSIQEKLFVLDPLLTVYPGHGEPTTIGHEKRFNPFLQEVTS